MPEKARQLLELLGEPSRLARRQLVPHQRTDPIDDLGDGQQTLHTRQIDAPVVHESLDRFQTLQFVT